MDHLTFRFGSSDIRVTQTDPLRGSVVDLIVEVTGKDAHYSAGAFKRICERFPEVATKVSYFKFGGRGQRDTPVADAKGLWSIICLLPGRASAVFREKSGDVMIRYLGGDESLITEIKQNRALQNELEATDPQHALRFIGASVENAAGPQENAIALQEKMLELENLKSVIEERKTMNEERKMRIRAMEIENARMMITFGDELMDTFEADERDMMFLKDAKRTCIRRIFGAHTTIDPSSALALPGTDCVSQRHEITISDVAKSMGLPHTAHDVLIRYGRACAKLFKTEKKTDPVKAERYVHGMTRTVNCYYDEDRELLERAIRSTL
jgi:hypothetical protein